jgi:hypothetical protein
MAKQGKGSKAGRNKDKCASYRSRGQREKNKARRAARIQRGFRWITVDGKQVLRSLAGR